MKTQITTILAVCGALLASATTASAFMPGDGAGQICIFGKDVHCWHDPATYSWQKDHPDFAENKTDLPLHVTETEVAEIDTSGFVGNSTAAVSETELHTTELASTEFGECLVDDAPIDLEKLTGCRSDACTPNPYFNYFKYYR